MIVLVGGGPWSSARDIDSGAVGVAISADGKDEVCEVSPRHREVALQVQAAPSAVLTSERLVGEAWGSQDRPVQPAGAHALFHRDEVCENAVEPRPELGKMFDDAGGAGKPRVG